MAKPLLCPECGATVAAGRLSCRECGALLAAVVGGARSVTRMVEAAAEEMPTLLPDATPDESPAGPMALSTSADEAVAPDAEPRVRTRAPRPQRERSRQAVASAGSPAGDGDTRPAEERPAQVDRVETNPPPVPQDWAAQLPPAGIPLPASATFEPGVPFAAVGAGDALPGNGSAAATADGSLAVRPHNGLIPKPGQASLLADLPIDAPDDVSGWLVAIGGALAVISFLLPWAAAGHTLIGDATLELNPGYVDSWGLAVPSSFLLVLTGLALLLLATWPNPIPRWIRGGVLPILGGGLFLGIDWIYTSASTAFGGGIGLVALLAGAGFLIAGGIIEVRPPRHDPAQPGV